MPPNSVAPMFPFHERASDWDEYGEIINPDDYISKVEDMMDYTLTQQVKQEILTFDVSSCLSSLQSAGHLVQIVTRIMLPFGS